MMRALCSVVILAVACGLLPAGIRAETAAPAEGVALAIVYDTSGSMKATVRDSSGKSEPKEVIGKRALGAVLRRLEQFAAREESPGVRRRIEFGLFTFDGNRIRPLVPFGAFEAKQAGTWPQRIPGAGGGTPLGLALETAGRAVLRSPLLHKHVLVITDGENTIGSAPEVLLRQLQNEAAAQQTALAVHFVAFDVDAKVFAPVKQLGATVVGAIDEIQLNTQLGVILEKKILLEEEEPATTPQTH